LPVSLAGREVDGEWIAASFNGGGMAFCWSAGKAVVAMMCGEDISDWFPEPFFLSEGRLKSSLSVKESVSSMEATFPNYMEG